MLAESHSIGSRSHRLIPYDENFRLLTLPTTQRGKVRVDPNQGVQIKHIHYWSNTFRDPEIQKQNVDVRYDPFDAGIAYAYVHGQWVECISEHYSSFRGRSEKELSLASAELHKRHQNHAKQFQLKAKQLAAFLSTAEAEEVLLEQRLRDAQAQEVLKVIDGGLPNQIPYEQSRENTRVDSTDIKELETQPIRNTSLDLNKLQIYSEY